MKNTKQLLVITSIAAGITLGGKSAHAQQAVAKTIPKQTVQNYNEYSNVVVGLNYNGEIVKHIQSTLNLYFGAGLAEDGIYGKATENAVKNIQKKLGVNADGVFGPKTAKALLNHIGANSSNDGDGFSPASIDIQKQFVSLGYNIPLNGDLSYCDTILAIKDFQRKNCLPVTGKIDSAVLNKLNEKTKDNVDETTGFKSDTNYYITVNSSDHVCKIYQKVNNTWKEIKCFDILSGKVDKGTYMTGLQGKEVNLNKVAMKNFTQINGLNVFYSAEKDSGYGLRVSDEAAQLLSVMPHKTAIKIF